MFARSFSDKDFANINSREQHWMPELPGKETAHVMPLVLTGNAMPTSLQVQYASYKRDGKPEWLLKFASNLCVVNCLTYTRWEGVWSRARALLNHAVGSVELGENSISALQLEYVDHFTREGDPSSYSAADLFRAPNRHLTEFAISAEEFGHVHQGRYERQPGGGRLLNIVNVQGTYDGLSFQGVSVNHIQRRELATAITNWHGARAIVESTFDELHNKNKGMMRELLADEMCSAIHLGDNT